MSELGSEGARHALGRDGAREAGRREVGREVAREGRGGRGLFLIVSE